jgi:hypothetical protein
MKNVSNIKLNILMEKLYIEGAVNRIYEESSDFDWIRDVVPQEDYPKHPTRERGIAIGGSSIHTTRPIWFVKKGDKVKFISPLNDDEYIFTVEYVDGWGAWGSDMPSDRLITTDGERNVHNLKFLTHPNWDNSVNESSDFDWVGEADIIDLSFKEQELWIDISMLDNNDKNIVMNYLRDGHDADIGSNSLREFRRHVEMVKGLVFHCELTGYNTEVIPIENALCVSYGTHENDDDSPNAQYVNGADVVPQAKHHFSIEESRNINESDEEEKDPSIIDDTLSDLNLSRSFLFTFGTGIGALMEPVTKLLEGSGVHLTSTQISLLVITALAMMLNESNTKGAVKKLKEEGI